MFEDVVLMIPIEFGKPHGVSDGEPQVGVAFLGMLPMVSDADVDGLSSEVFEVGDIGERPVFDIEPVTSEGIVPFVAAVLVGDNICSGPIEFEQPIVLIGLRQKLCCRAADFFGVAEQHVVSCNSERRQQVEQHPGP